MDKKTQDPQMARFLRKKQQRDGDDEQEDVEDADFIANPMKSANKYGKKKTEKSVEKQVQYFGVGIQPFHMQKDEDIGQFDEQGFFLFNRKKRVRDAWLDSIGEGEDGEVADKIAKRIKSQSRFQSVYEGSQKMNDKMKQDEQEEEQDQVSQKEGEQEEDKQNQKGVMSGDGGFSITDMIELMIEFMPDKGNANKYMKKLKADKNMEQYNRLLTLSNEYIEKTGEYDILTKSKEQLKDLLADKREQDDGKELNWDEDEEQEDDNGGKTEKVQKDEQEDNIF